MKREAWYRRHLAFVLTSGALFFALRALTTMQAFEKHVLQPYLQLSTNVSAWLLGLLRHQVEANGSVLTSGSFGVEIRRGCDAIEPTVLLIAAILATPITVRHKAIGLLAGCAVLVLTNLMRIVSLFLIGAHFPGAFQMAHVAVWQAAFVGLVIVFWLLWTRWSGTTVGAMSPEG